jgi:hypothetical protein
VTIAGDPGFSVASATNSNAIRAKPTTAKKVKAGIAALPCTQLNTRSNVRFRKTQALKKRPRRRGPYDATHFGHSLGSSRLGSGIRSPSRSANVNARQLSGFPEFLFQFQRCERTQQRLLVSRCPLV